MPSVGLIPIKGVLNEFWTPLIEAWNSCLNFSSVGESTSSDLITSAPRVALPFWKYKRFQVSIEICVVIEEIAVSIGGTGY